MCIRDRVSTQSTAGWSPLHCAIYHHHSDTAKLLLKKGASPNLDNNVGKTPKDLATEKGVLAVLQYIENPDILPQKPDEEIKGEEHLPRGFEDDVHFHGEDERHQFIQQFSLKMKEVQQREEQIKQRETELAELEQRLKAKEEQLAAEYLAKEAEFRQREDALRARESVLVSSTIGDLEVPATTASLSTSDSSSFPSSSSSSSLSLSSPSSSASSPAFDLTSVLPTDNTDTNVLTISDVIQQQQPLTSVQ
eukprot:TRINITY_DN13918_c0_g1_i1.p1 TRINITY_DN13918_c0_g1~~TRINITY_DN13918_c0_g1_i1.p1  ORF type:complete len:250 (+),score=85.90 TRINITY_DN13918_c0_g1_i1:3-752(+)